MLYETLPALLIPLPEDIRRMEDHGDYARARRMIGLRVGNESLPEALRTRLQLEAQMLERVPGDYPYTFDAALELLQKEIRDFTAEELDAAIDAGRVSWILLDGGLRLHRLFLDTLVKVRPELEPRIIDPERLRYKRENFAILDDVIREMKQHGGAARRWHVRHTLQIKPEWERAGEPVRVDLPLPVEYDCVKNFRLLDCGPVPGQVASPDAAQRTITFEKKLCPGEAFFAEYSFEVHMPCHDLDPARAGGGVPADEPDALSQQPPHIAFTPLIRAFAREIAGEERNPLLLARRVYDALTTRPIYSYLRSYFTYPNLAEYLLTDMKGDCGAFAVTFIALCRCLGIPARWQSGLYCAPHDVGCHDWAQFYCAPWGWLPVDVSFGNAAFHAGDTERWDFYFGHMDPFRLPAARAFQAPFEKPKRFLRSDPYDNQNGEVEYVDMGLTRAQFTERCQLLDWAALTDA